jgi:hypothetical protein
LKALPQTSFNSASTSGKGSVKHAMLSKETMFKKTLSREDIIYRQISRTFEHTSYTELKARLTVILD